MASALIVQEPGGERQLLVPVRLGGVDPDIVLPAPVDARLSIESRGSQWMLRIAEGSVSVNGRPHESDCPLVSGDVIGTGGAQLVLRLEGTPRLSIYPLRGNDTIAPLATVQIPGEEVASGTREIRVAGVGEDVDDVFSDPRAAVQRTRVAGYAAAASILVALLVAALWWIVPVEFAVTPATAEMKVAGRLHWQLGDRLYLPQGSRTIDVSSPGYHSERITLQVDRTLAEAPPQRVELALLPGIVKIDTQGIAAEVLVDGEPAGAAPGNLNVNAGRRSVLVRAPRHIDFLSEIDVEGAGREQSLVAKLEPAWGWLELDTRPANARIEVDGKDLGTTPQRLELDSGLHQLAIRAPGRRGWRSQVAIVAGQTLSLGVIDLAVPPPAVMAQTAPPDTSAAAQPVAAPRAAPATRITSALIGNLILVPAGSFMQGSERREQGRRSNESLRTVTLPQPFYLAEREVTNSAFRAFRAAHASGIAAERTLDLDAFAVSSVDWDDAVAFCNWLSQREELPLAYERREGRWQLVEPFNHGYRLPTEAEWEYAARYVDGQRFRRFSWGDALPPPAGAENISGDEVLAGKSPARAMATLPGYLDEHVVVAPGGTYGRTALGLADIGGNVSEWVHDVYASLLPSTPVTNPRGESAAGPHVIRGANWRTASIQELRLAWRDRSSGPQQTLGFRVARNAEVSP